MKLDLQEKLQILADAAKYDVSCSSSGSKRKNEGGLGNATGMGICHTHTEDGRCVSLLKLLLTNHCIYDCAYCVTRRSNDVKRAAFTVQEVVDLTINFYRRNYIEGLFLSSGIFKNADYTMERLVRVAKKLREEHNFSGYIHLKGIPGASEELLRQAGQYADRVSINIEMPTEMSLQQLAPEKNHQDVFVPMDHLRTGIQEFKEERKKSTKAPLFAPAGQSTQMVIGATPENDQQILTTADSLYKKFELRRVYYSGYVPISDDGRLPGIGTPVPMIRENRLYQADWLMRLYGFQLGEIVSEQFPHLDLDVDPKVSWALRNRAFFPVDVNTADYALILRVPGIGHRSAQRIVAARKYQSLHPEHLRKFGVVWNRARFFLTGPGSGYDARDYASERLKVRLLSGGYSKYRNLSTQLTLFAQSA
ncbi:putative DNA modification/repair radical SAM protein [Catalinimonas alkaloidigena]|uniref:Putative DNA modification/repair radical SAM protein n=1 Tax=Catalinimonas alkaloidigena TaxID=1075417 RepID=A0A1G9UBM8_9BACT|nr:putative DNA modification/repair radical SAM protein [Catalinimonas alkaloidigena]SDM57367.1 putative DNA modification/repair radical SAM protein [Catalinimonas alkaloidigena]